EPVRIGAFLDDGPGASPGLPLRAAELTAAGGAARNTLAFFRAQRPPYLPARAAVTAQGSGGSVLTVQFAAPAPLPGWLPKRGNIGAGEDHTSGVAEDEQQPY